MFTTLVIAFREFLEVFLIIGLFLGVSRKLSLKKELEIILAGTNGIFLSLLLITVTYIFGDYARAVLTEKNADALESYLLIFSGLFIVYVVFSLHKTMNKSHRQNIAKTQEKMEQKVFDISLFLTIVFLIIREGFEIALFTASTSLFASFFQNVGGLIIGLFCAGIIGILTSLAYIKISLKHVFQLTEYFIILLGASLFQNGITLFLQTHFGISLSGMIPFHLYFLPSEDTFVGGLLQNFLGVDAGFSLIRLLIMLGYIFAVYLLFIRQNALIKRLKFV